MMRGPVEARVSGKCRIAISVPTSKDLDYNRRSWPNYAEAVRQAGGTPVEIGLTLSETELMELARACDGVLLPGSPADVNPERYGQQPTAACAPSDPAREVADRLLLEEAYAAKKPVLAICYGVQSLNVWRGGSLVQDLSRTAVNHSAGAGVAVAHAISLQAGGILSGLAEAGEEILSGDEPRLLVNSSHHQAVELPGDGLHVVAVSSQDGVVEAIEATGDANSPEFVVGVQWHPERSVDISATSRAIFEALMAAAAKAGRNGVPRRER